MIDDVANVSECGLDSLIDNAFIVGKFEQFKLELNGKKCHKMHVGKENVFCPTLKAHEVEMDPVLEEKYLGDIVSYDGKHSKNIKARSSKCIGATVDIMNLVKLLCLGQYHFKVCVILRQAMLLSMMLQNAESWLRLTQADIKQLESTDEILLRKILSAPSSSPRCSLYLSLGCIPARFLIKAKRVMFLHYLLKRDRSETISQVFWAQVNQPVKGDWCLVVMEDLEALGLGHLSLKDLEIISKYKMKRVVKEATRRTAFDYLMKQKETLSKIG